MSAGCRNHSSGNIGVFVSARRGTVGETIQERLGEHEDAILAELDMDAEWQEGRRHSPICYRPYGDLDDPAHRREALDWLRDRVNRYINVFRLRVQAMAEEMGLS